MIFSCFDVTRVWQTDGLRAVAKESYTDCNCFRRNYRCNDSCGHRVEMLGCMNHWNTGTRQVHTSRHLNINTHSHRRLKPCPHCRRKVRVSQKSANVAEKWDCRRKRRLSPNSATVAVFCDSRTFLRQCGQGLTERYTARLDIKGNLVLTLQTSSNIDRFS